MQNQFKEIPANKQSIANRTSIFGIGKNDADYMTSAKIDGKQVMCPFYRKWLGMIRRCYCEKLHKKQPTYTECSVCDEWLTSRKFKAGRWMKSPFRLR